MTMLYRIDDPWCRHIPTLHRALTDETLVDQLPRPSDATSLEEACAIWETLHYLFKALLGWQNPGRGLAWWYAAGKPIEDSPLLNVVSRVWDQHQELDYYAAWAWTNGQGFMTPDEFSPVALARGSMYSDEGWWRNLKRRGRTLQRDPFYGGTNPLHLGHSDDFGFGEVHPDQARLHADQAARETILIVNHLGTWRRDLQNAGNRLPALGKRSWHVEVFDRQFGYLGLYRQSRASQCWFMGKHGVHMRGNVEPSTEVAA